MNVIGIDNRDHPTRVTISFIAMHYNDSIRFTAPIQSLSQAIHPFEARSGANSVLFFVDICYDLSAVIPNYFRYEILEDEYNRFRRFIENPYAHLLPRAYPISSKPEPKPIIRRPVISAIMELQL